MGESVNTLNTDTTGAKTMFAWGCVALLFVALAAPVVQMPIVGSINVFGAQDGVAYWFLGFAVLAALAAFFKFYRLLALPGALVIGTILYYVYRLQKVKADLATELRGNPFAGLATGLASTIHLEWGVAVLIVAGILLVVAAMLKRDAETLPKLVLANQPQFIKGAAAVGIIFLAIALLPGILSLSTKSKQSLAGVANPLAAMAQPDNVATEVPDPKIAELRRVVMVGILEKGFHTADPSNYEYEDVFTVRLQYHNLGKKTVSGVKGFLRFFDQFNDLIQSFRVENQETLRPGAVVAENDRYDYDRFEEQDAKLRSTPLSKLHVVWEPNRINYADGSSSSTR